MPFIKAKNGNIVELAADLVKEFLAQGHEGPFETEAHALAGERMQEPPAGTPLTDEELARVAAAESGKEQTPTPPTIDVERPSRGASLAAWAAYADTHGFTFPEGAGRDEIRDLVEAAEKED